MSRLRFESGFEPTPDRITSQLAEVTRRAPAVAEVPALVVVWSLREPHRLGEVIVFDDFTPRIIGRGGPRTDDGAPRAPLTAHRPGLVERRPALNGPALSRRHVRLTPDSDGIAVERLGKGTVGIDGELADAGFVQPGGTLLLSGEILLMCERRPVSLPLSPGASPPTFPFGLPDPSGLCGETPTTWRLRDQARFVAGAGSPLLINGPSGSGKELLARAVHQASAWRARPFVLAGGATLTRAELDALVARPDAPFIVIDELADVPAEVQPFLTRAIAHTLSQPLPRARFVATATGTTEGVRPDLLSRFILGLRVPALDERRADIPLIARAILREIAREQPEVAARFFDLQPGQAPEEGEPRVDVNLVELLLRHPWRSHVRELTGLLWRAMTTAQGPQLEATPELVAQLSDVPRGFVDPGALDRDTVQAALSASNGKVAVAARALGLKNRWVLYRLMEKLDIVP